MFNLIIAIIAIAIIVVLTMAGIYHGGAAFTGNKISADAARYRTEAGQIASAITLYKNDGNEVNADFQLQDLITQNYLKQLPVGWEPGDNKVIFPLDTSNPASEEICITANDQAGYKFSGTDSDVDAFTQDPSRGIPHCNKAGLETLVPCCVEETGTE
ncbi:hypothetical protein D3C87_849050 [compost metagenome]